MRCGPDCDKLTRAMKLISRGALGLAKAIMGLDPAPPEVIEQRREICRSCEYAEPCKWNPAKRCKCIRCGCALREKTMIAEESCPIGKWSANKEQGAK